MTRRQAAEERALNWLARHEGVASLSSPDIKRCPDFVAHRLGEFVERGWMRLRPHFGGQQVYEATAEGLAVIAAHDGAVR